MKKMNLISIAIIVFFPVFSMAAETKAQVIPGPAAPTTVVETPELPVNWVSHSSSEPVTINNGNGNSLTITINVAASTIPNVTVPGVNVKNCGQTKHIDAGSSAICTTHDAANPVSFASDSQNTASGTYQVKQNK